MQTETAPAATFQKLNNFALGQWTAGEGEGTVLQNAITGESFATVSTTGLDFGMMCDYARTVGGPNLRKMTFHERGRMLKALALFLLERKEIFYQLSWATGATRQDSWVDIEGGIGNLFSYASLRRQFPNEIYCLDGEAVKLSK